MSEVSLSTMLPIVQTLLHRESKHLGTLISLDLKRKFGKTQRGLGHFEIYRKLL